MSLNKLVNKLNLNDEMFVPKIEGCNCEEGEQELVDPSEVNETVTEITDDLNDIEEADTIVEDVNGFLVEREPYLYQDGTTKDVPIEERIIVQEKLREVLRVSGLTLTNSLNKESLTNIDAYYMNIEGLKEVMSNIGEVVKSIWDKIVETIKKLIAQLATFLPTKINRLNSAIKALEDYKGFNIQSGDIATLEYNFEKEYLDKYVAISNVFPNQDRLGYFKSMDKFANELEGYFRNFKAGQVENPATGIDWKKAELGIKVNPLIKKEASPYSNKEIYSVKTHYKTIKVSMIDRAYKDEVKVETKIIEDLFKKYSLDFSVNQLIHRLTVDKECLNYTKGFMDRLKNAAENISKIVGDSQVDTNARTGFKTTINSLFKTLFVDYTAVSDSLTNFDLATAKILLRYFKRIKR